MNSNSFFKRVIFGGFKRDDVIEYIDGLHGELESAKREAEEVKAEAEELRRKNEALSAENSSLNSRVESVKSDNENLSESLSDTRHSLDVLKTKLEVTEFERDEFKEKAVRADKIEAQVGSMIADANVYREKLIAGAKKEISDLSYDYTEKAEEAADKFTLLKEEVNAVSSAVAESFAGLAERIAGLTDDIKAGIETISVYKEEKAVSAETAEYKENFQAENTSETVLQFESVSAKEKSGYDDVTDSAFGGGSAIPFSGFSFSDTMKLDEGFLN